MYGGQIPPDDSFLFVLQVQVTFFITLCVCVRAGVLRLSDTRDELHCDNESRLGCRAWGAL